jgi:anaerobic ribonucleoside-triphosphate reductase activating protein
LSVPLSRRHRPDWIPQRQARVVAASELAGELLANASVDGLTFSRGEPMLQAGGLAALARAVRDVTIICFTGYQLARLRQRPPAPRVGGLLTQVDVLIDGQPSNVSTNGSPAPKPVTTGFTG